MLCFIIQSIKKLGIHHAYNKVISRIRLRDDDKQDRLMVSDSAKIYIVPPGQICDLRDIERVKAYRCGNKDGL